MYFLAREVFHWATESHLASPNGIITFSGGKQTLHNAELTCGVLREHGLEQVPQGGRAPRTSNQPPNVYHLFTLFVALLQAVHFGRANTSGTCNFV